MSPQDALQQRPLQHRYPLPPSPTSHSRKRKAAPLDGGERRLSKRLSLLNLGVLPQSTPSLTLLPLTTCLPERSGSKLYVPVETPSLSPSTPAPTPQQPPIQHDDVMQLDDDKHKVYIYNMDDDLSSDSEPDDGRLVFLPDIDRHLRQTRIPPAVLASPEGELAGMQVVLYNDPRSLTVPEERDGVRRAILDARQRLRDKQKRERDEGAEARATTVYDMELEDSADVDAMDVDMCPRID
ncbi:hypothetical protein CDD80_584 [Ophiocordyceps camponoti-rufipedis]|uniref:Uncharacterized protein n=1 Tax=Ophiocordyceps camponoti-rufipedis TaxID=2004952 RepID=A0A2C5Z6J1_9HYPO|nr:hypothetical protein CDD80_584 [Ophiocordyceps camponoti-rufipedis]